MASQPLLSSEPPTISLAPKLAPSLSSASPSSQGSPSPNPVRSDPRFELLQKEFNSPHDLTHPTHQPNWELVGDLAESLLAEKGPDYLVALWLALARVKLGLWAGLYESLIHLNALFKESWDKMEPPRSRLVGRQNLARWWEAQTTETLRAFLPLAKPLTRDYVNRLMDKLSILESALAKLEPTWEPCFWSLRGMVGEWPVQGETPPESFATFKSDGQTSSAIDNVIDLNDPPLSLQAPQGSRWPLLFGGILVGFLALFIVFFMYPLAEKTLEPEAASFRVPEIQEPASPLDHLINPLGQTILEPRPPKL
ncbi:MAG: type VI secretion system ImpA family N-terminal domain-containing protein, partial [Deltaproteobacteria bacterium]|nr:type VI secretion system ImpA family N-terminal domain-containing protein [Deltaproteobacteria bacterium]